MLAARPTGRPGAQAFVDTVNQKFADAKAALMAARPTGRPVGGNKHQHNQAKWEVRITRCYGANEPEIESFICGSRTN